MRALHRVAPLLFCSGLCALVYQVTWLRELRLVFGASTAASAAVLAVFMGGLGVGGALLGKRVDGRKDPLGFYATLELIVAISSAATPLFVTLARRAYAGVGGTVVLGQGGGTVVRLLLALLVLGVPTFAMGGTLPAASRAVESDTDAGRKSLAVLYGVNTLGAVVGAALANFILIEVFGNQLTLWLACLVNLLVAVIARGVSRGLVADREALEAASKKDEAPAENADEGAGLSAAKRAPAPFVLLSAGVVGFAFLLMELVWYRMLGPILGGSSYTFGLILAVALLGIGLGGAAYAFRRKDSPPTLRGFAFTCALEALCIGIPFALGDRIALLALFTRPLGNFGFSGLVAHWFVVAGIVILPAALVSGYQFPLLIGLLGRGARDVGRDVGFAYAANTAGSIVGSLAGGFGLIPALTAPGCWRLVVACLATLGAASLALSIVREQIKSVGDQKKDRPGIGSAIGVASIAAISVAFLFARGPTAAWRHSPIGAGRADVVAQNATKNAIRAWQHGQRSANRWEVDGVESSVALDTRGGTAFIVNGKSDGSAILDAPTQVWSGLIGAVLHPEPKRAMVVGLGTGSTAGWLGLVPTMERVDVVEIEPAILHVARACAPVNGDVLNNPKVSIFIGDAREVLSTTRERYDLVFSEPSNPYRAGISSLYTEDFYRAAALRLAEGGIFLQWMQSYEVDGQAVRTVFATVSSVFPTVSVWQTQTGDMILLATLAPMQVDADALRKRIELEPYRSAMRHVYRADSLEAFLAHHVAGPDLAKQIAKLERFSVSTDDRNLLEFAFARSVGKGRVFGDDEIWGLSRLLSVDRLAIARGKVDWDLVADSRVIDDTVGITVGKPNPARLESYQLLARWRRGDLPGVARRIGKIGVPEPRSLVEIEMIAEALAEAGDDRAIPYIDRVRHIEPAEAELLRARLLVRHKELPAAVSALEQGFSGLRESPWTTKEIADRALGLVSPIARVEPSLAPRLLAALASPFSVNLVDLHRKMVAFELAARMPGDECARLLEDMEPDVPWNGPFLDNRLRCYERLDHPRKARALADVREFVENESPPFMDGFDIDKPEGGDAKGMRETEGPSQVPQNKPSDPAGE